MVTVKNAKKGEIAKFYYGLRHTFVKRENLAMKFGAVKYRLGN